MNTLPADDKNYARVVLSDSEIADLPRAVLHPIQETGFLTIGSVVIAVPGAAVVSREGLESASQRAGMMPPLCHQLPTQLNTPQNAVILIAALSQSSEYWTLTRQGELGQAIEFQSLAEPSARRCQ